MTKKRIRTIHEKNSITENIINAMVEKKSFLICGHKDPDEDCISSMIAFAILLSKFDKTSHIYIDEEVPEKIYYLQNICKYNSIQIINNTNNLIINIDTIVICDTPKFTMIDINDTIKKEVLE